MKLDGQDGYLLLNKRSGETSFDALSKVKRALGTRRVGHSGTLDKFAEGLLVVLVGRSTRLVPWFTGCDKLYEGTITFGQETDTLDPEGAVVGSALPPSKEKLESVLPLFLGDLMQAPPLYSSVHVDGRRAHELARAGVEVEMKKRPVSIRSLDLLSYDGTAARIRVGCSKGTYIRSLARDIALAADSRAHLSALTRLEVAGFSLKDAADPAAALDPEEEIRKACRSIDAAAFSAIGVTNITVTDAIAQMMMNGRPIDPSWLGFADPTESRSSIAVFDESGRFIAIVEMADGRWSYGYVSARPEMS